jgi:hypothetical protein
MAEVSTDVTATTAIITAITAVIARSELVKKQTFVQIYRTVSYRTMKSRLYQSKVLEIRDFLFKGTKHVRMLQVLFVGIILITFSGHLGRAWPQYPCVPKPSDSYPTLPSRAPRLMWQKVLGVDHEVRAT